MDSLWRDAKPKPLPKPLADKAAWDAARKSAKPYSRLEHYVVGGSLMHPKFGLGRVQRLVTPDTIEVLFENGVPRTLGIGRSSPWAEHDKISTECATAGSLETRSVSSAHDELPERQLRSRNPREA